MAKNLVIVESPAKAHTIEKYLGSGLIKGIEPKFARKIVQRFGKDTLDVIEENPDALIDVPGIGRLHHPQITGQRVSDRRDAVHDDALHHAAAGPSVHGRDPGKEDSCAHRREERDQAYDLQQQDCGSEYAAE